MVYLQNGGNFEKFSGVILYKIMALGAVEISLVAIMMVNLGAVNSYFSPPSNSFKIWESLCLLNIKSFKQVVQKKL